ncbi:hypothetical protein SAMN04515671_3616 [Nakamurella panacisegetis]|uniref:Uncharacterized protein n=1 Tax=Nakamurella panacisegetis TaxID=1090615 RepID=A0A1H0RLC1_9ACTN|nr:hypothetical protein SAMN04515671_3616 [Nakamurella panacisegetis]
MSLSGGDQQTLEHRERGLLHSHVADCLTTGPFWPPWPLPPSPRFVAGSIAPIAGERKDTR